MDTWADIRAWRKSTRARLLSLRLAMPRGRKQSIRLMMQDRLHEQFSRLRDERIGFYWPFKGEVDLRHVIHVFLTLGAEAALPVVVEKQQPLEFWSWRPGMRLGRGIWNIPVPAESNPIRPTTLLVPLLGFDTAGYRLGYGGGYYDRTLASMKPRPRTIGVGYELGRLESIYPQPHDIPLDVIVTEAGSVCFRHRGERLGGASGSGESTIRLAKEDRRVPHARNVRRCIEPG